MTGAMRGVVVLVALAALTGCGGGEPAAKKESTSAPTSASSEPTPVETDECRAAMDQADTIATELESATLEDGAAFGQYEDRLAALYKTAAQTCGPRVSVDFGEAMQSMARVSARFTACSFQDPMFQCDVAKDLIEGASLIHQAATTAAATA